MSAPALASAPVSSPANSPLVGLHQIDERDYHNHPAVGRSDIKNARRSYDHFIQGRKSRGTPTPEMLFGTAYHLRMMEEAEFNRRVKLATDEMVGQSKAAKELRAKLAIEQPDALWFDAEELGRLELMRESALANPKLRMLLEADGMTEVSAFWHDPATGLHCRARPDRIIPTLGVMLDLKSSVDASPEAFRQACARYGYHLQSAWYPEGVLAASGQSGRAIIPEAPQMIFGVVEKQAPFSVALYTLPKEQVAMAWNLCAAGLETIRAGAAGEGPTGYPTDIQTLELPPWSFN